MLTRLTGLTALIGCLLLTPVLAAELPPQSLLDFGRETTIDEVLTRLGDDADISGNANSRSYYYSFVEGYAGLRFDVNTGDARVQVINLTFWPSEEMTLDRLTDGLKRLGLPLQGTEFLQLYSHDFTNRFGTSEASFSETWLNYPFPEGGHMEFYLSGEPARCTDITLNFGYEGDIPAEFEVEVAPPATGREDLRARKDFFRVPLGCTDAELARIKGQPASKQDWSEDYPDWNYHQEGADINIIASLSRVGEYDAEYEKNPKALLLTRVSLDVYSLDDVRNLATARQQVVAAGWGDALVDTIGFSRAELRELYGDPDAFSSYDWTYEVPGPDWTTAISFRFSGKAEHARLIGLTVSRW